MRFRSIHLPAFGPFTDFDLSLPQDGGDFHVIYGPNEAGKSSLLRALRALLFGIPARTGDNFLHASNRLRLAAELEKRNGTTGYFQRRKGNKNTLLDRDDAPLAESVLGEFLSGVDEAYFDSMFGLGADELRDGADTLLRGEGRLGEALFSARLGGTPVDRVIQELEAEAAGLFRGRGGSKIRDVRREHDEHLKLAKEGIVKPDAWDEIEKAIAKKSDERNELTRRHAELTTRRAWLERCGDAIPLLGQYRDLGRRLSELPAMPALGGNFAEEIREARRAWTAETGRVNTTEARLAKLTAELAACPVDAETLDLAAEIESLHSGLAIYLEKRETVVHKRADGLVKKQEIDTACRDLELSLDPHERDACRVSQVKFLEVETAAFALLAAEEEVRGAEQSLLGLKREIETLENQRTSSDPDEIAKLEKAVAAAVKWESLPADLASRQAKLDEGESDLLVLRSRLTGAPEDVSLLGQLALPAKSRIETFRDEFSDDAAARKTLEQKRSTLASDLDRLLAERDRLVRQRNLPSLTDLTAARDLRERGWQLVLQDWKGPGVKEELLPGVPLDEAFAQTVSAADDLADRLRVEAEAVAQIEEKNARITFVQKQLQDLQTETDRLHQAGIDRETRWAELWKSSGIKPQSPAEMMAWRDDWEACCRKGFERNRIRDSMTHDQAAMTQSATALRKVLGLAEDDLSALLAEARTRINSHHQSVGDDRAVRRQITEKSHQQTALTEALPVLEKKRTEAQSTWKSMAVEMALPAGLTPKAAVEVLRSRRDLFQTIEGWRQATNETSELQSQIDAYEHAVGQVASRLKQDTTPTAAAAVTALWKTLGTTRLAATRAEHLQDQITQTQAERDDSRRLADQARAGFESLLNSTSLGDENALDGFLVQFEKRRELEREQNALRTSLAALARDEPVDVFLEKVQNENELDASLTLLKSEIGQAEVDSETCRSALQELTKTRAELENASDTAARETQLSELAAARMQQDAERFVRLHVAITLLRSRIDRFREQNQGPFMEKASHWFAEITGGAFSGTATQYDAGDQPVVAGQRSGASASEPVPIHGMSQGTRDQLYLALRLAGLELHLDDHEPMPLILDDLLVHFDDQRSARALQALGTFGQKSQVLLFTHHRHLVELAHTACDKNGIHFHELPGDD